MPRTRRSLEQIAQSRRWTNDDAKTVLNSLGRSGLSVAAFAALHGVQAQRLFAWRRKLGAQEGFAQRPIGFVEIDRAAAPPVSRRYEVVLPGGVALRIEGGVDAEEVDMLLGVLRRPSSC